VARRTASGMDTGEAGTAGQGAPAGPGLRHVTGGAAASGARQLDRLIHERVRLGIVSALAVNESLTFIELRRLLGTTDGNLSVHARKLEDAGYLTCTKSFEGRQPKTEYRLTEAGTQALEGYLAHMETVIASVRRA